MKIERNNLKALSKIKNLQYIGEIRQAITDNLYDEEHGPNNHRELWLRFGEEIGAKRKDIEQLNSSNCIVFLIENMHMCGGI